MQRASLLYEFSDVYLGYLMMKMTFDNLYRKMVFLLNESSYETENVFEHCLQGAVLKCGKTNRVLTLEASRRETANQFVKILL